MSVKLLFDKPKKELRKKLKPIPLSKNTYEDTENILNSVRQNIQLPDDYVEPIRIRLIQENPVAVYRVTIFRVSKEKRPVKNKNETTSLVFAGKYVWKQFLVTKVNPQEFVWSPELETN